MFDNVSRHFSLSKEEKETLFNMKMPEASAGSQPIVEQQAETDDFDEIGEYDFTLGGDDEVADTEELESADNEVLELTEDTLIPGDETQEGNSENTPAEVEFDSGEMPRVEEDIEEI